MHFNLGETGNLAWAMHPQSRQLQKAVAQWFGRPETRELLDRFNLELDPMTRVKRLTMGKQQILEILKAISTNPKILILDEPTSSLDTSAGAVIEELMVNLKDRCTLLMVSHYLDQVKRIADTILELSDGKLIDYK